jgi:hypothetical protein
MFRKVILSTLIGLLGVGAVAAGAQPVVLVVLGSLAFLGWVATGRRRPQDG